MGPLYEPTALLVVMAVLVAEHGLAVRLGIAADCLVVTAGAATSWGDVHLSVVEAVWWLTVAAVTGDQVARLGGLPPPRDPLGLLARADTAGWYAVASLCTGVMWTAGLVLAGRVIVGVALL
ncbi:hypothetical protein [Nocardioides sp. URHA0020]|uniref:hypothetical protein n=1 Tax=Nocardioides sp. URHA0020 TaxID=1380392 RepID=UPI00048E35BB|nr:hypothetical protein [Nocardioides sp. URHA0020]